MRRSLRYSPGQTVVIKDAQAYGLILLQGHGAINKMRIETPNMIRFGQLTSDEMFVTQDAALQGVTIHNESEFEELVMLKHFGPENPEAALFVRTYPSSTGAM